MSIKKYFAENAATIALGLMSISGTTYISSELVNAATKEIKNNTKKRASIPYKKQVVTA